MSAPRLCPAKLNLALSVGPPDPSTGYHPIASWMVALSFGDELHLVRARETRFDRAFAQDAPEAPDTPDAPDAPQPQRIDWPLERDLAWRAHRLVEEVVGRPLPVEAIFRKRIPTGAGLGGGSSNAAAMLVGLDELFDLHLGRERLIELSRRLGSDVAFLVGALHGDASAIVTGEGEKVQPTPLPQPVDVALILPPLKCPTAAVYAALDAGRPMASEAATLRVERLATSWPLHAHELFNDLVEPAMQVTPALRDIHARLAAITGRPVHITGSGAAMFIVGSSPSDARDLAALVMKAGTSALATRTLLSPPAAPGSRIVEPR